MARFSLILLLLFTLPHPASAWFIDDFISPKAKTPAYPGAPLRTGGAEYTDPTTGMEFVFVKGGCYQMGSNSGDANEKPVHEVCVDDFYIGKYEVTQD